MASPFALSLAATLPRAACRASVAAAGASSWSSRLAFGPRAFSTLRTAPAAGFPRASSSSATSRSLQARHLSLGWPFKKTEPDLIVPRAPADIEPAPLASSPPPVDPNPLPATPATPSGAPAAPEPILSSSASPNFPQPPRSFEASSQASAPVDDAAGSAVDLATGILENGVDLRLLPEHIGDLRAQGLGSFWPAGLVQQAMEIIHVGTGIPWWGTIIVFTLLARAAMFPLILGGMRGAARLTRIQPELKQYQDALTSTSDERAKALLMQEMKALMKRENVSLFAPLKAPIVSMPLFLGTFWGLEAMCELPVWQLKVQGTAWFTDLTAADPTYILPITSALATWCIIHFGAAGTPPSAQASANSELINGIRRFMKYAVVAGIPIFGGFTIPAAVPLVGGLGPAGFPAAVLLYWTFSNGFTALQSFAFSLPAVRAYLDLPVIPPVDPTAPKPAERSLLRMGRDAWNDSKKKTDAKHGVGQMSREQLVRQKAQQAQAARNANARANAGPALKAAEDKRAAFDDAPSTTASSTSTNSSGGSGRARGATEEEEVLLRARAQSAEREKLEAQLRETQNRLRNMRPK